MVFAAIARKIFGTHNDRVLAEFQPLVAKINALEGDFEKLSDDQLLVKTRLFQEQAQAGRSLDELLPEAFANVPRALNAPWANGISMSSFWAGWFCTVA